MKLATEFIKSHRRVLSIAMTIAIAFVPVTAPAHAYAGLSDTLVDASASSTIIEVSQPLPKPPPPEPVYEEPSVQMATVITKYEDAFEIDVQTPSGLPLEFFEDMLPEALLPIAPELVRADEANINSLYLLAVVITEIGRDAEFVGTYNYGNFTTDTIHYMDFESTADCFDYMIDRYQSAFFNSDWHDSRDYSEIVSPDYGNLYFQDSSYTITEVNVGYALSSTPEGVEVNWAWQELVAEIMCEYGNKYIDWVSDTVDSN